jgi:hypothetical protein
MPTESQIEKSVEPISATLRGEAHTGGAPGVGIRARGVRRKERHQRNGGEGGRMMACLGVVWAANQAEAERGSRGADVFAQRSVGGQGDTGAGVERSNSMSDTIIFRGAYIRSLELRNGDDRHARIQMTADWTEPVRQHMEWDDAPEGFGACDLVGRLAASHIILTPNGKELKRHELQIAADDVNGFHLVPVKDGEGDVTRRELRFTVKTTQPDAAAQIEAYCQAIGRGAGQLKVSYVKQDELPLGDQQEPISATLRGEALEMHQAKERGLRA